MPTRQFLTTKPWSRSMRKQSAGGRARTARGDSFGMVMMIKWLLFLVLLAAPTWAAEVKLAWDAPDPPSEPIGYRIYQGVAAGVYDKHADAGTQMTWTMQGLEPGKTYYFAATALYRDDIESGYSNEVSKLIPVVGGPLNLKVTKVQITLEGE